MNYSREELKLLSPIYLESLHFVSNNIVSNTQIPSSKQKWIKLYKSIYQTIHKKFGKMENYGSIKVQFKFDKKCDLAAMTAPSIVSCAGSRARVMDCLKTF